MNISGDRTLRRQTFKPLKTFTSPSHRYQFSVIMYLIFFYLKLRKCQETILTIEPSFELVEHSISVRLSVQFQQFEWMTQNDQEPMTRSLVLRMDSW